MVRTGLSTRVCSGIVLGAALTVFALGNAAAAISVAAAREAVVSVKGMVCSACAASLEKRLSGLADVKKVVVTLEKEQAVVTFAPETKVTDKDIQKAVTDAGFNVTKIEWRTTTAD